MICPQCNEAVGGRVVANVGGALLVMHRCGKLHLLDREAVFAGDNWILTGCGQYVMQRRRP